MNFFLKNEVLSIIIAVACILILFFILRKQSVPIIKKILLGLVTGLILSSVLYFLFGMSLEIISLIGIITFFTTIFLTKIK